MERSGMTNQEKNNLKKFLYEDSGNIKVIKGYLVKEDDFCYTLLSFISNEQIVLGKRSIVKISDVSKEDCNDDSC